MSQDEHPVSFVVETLADKNIYEPLTVWIRELLPTARVPSSSKMPAPSLALILCVRSLTLQELPVSIYYSVLLTINFNRPAVFSGW